MSQTQRSNSQPAGDWRPLPAIDRDEWARWLDEADHLADLAAIAPAQWDRQLIAAGLGACPHLGLIAPKLPPDQLAMAIQGQPEAAARQAETRFQSLLASQPDEAMLMTGLRQFRQQTSFAAALGELAGHLDIEQSWQILTRAAETGLQAAVSWLLGQAAQKGQLPAGDANLAGTGWTILALGKLGAGELNYSSDIDLICLHDPAVCENPDIFVRLTRQLVHLLSAQTRDGFGWRVDLRLRPDPGATMVSLPLGAAISYYESLARTWERAAYIRARPLAGDSQLGQQFLDQISPFVWRKSLDFTVLEDLQGWLRHLPVPDLFHGFDVKLGAWGIRHVELLTHILQMLAGGANPELRSPHTLTALRSLEAAGQIRPGQAAELASCYKKWRKLEHRIQYQRDAHTHLLARNETEFSQFARLCGLPDGDRLRDRLASLQQQTRLAASHDLLDGMLARRAGSSRAGSSPAAAKMPADSEARLIWLADLGYQRPEDMLAIIDSWLGGRIAATRGDRARGYLTELLPRLMADMAAAGDPDAAFAAFADIIAGQPAGAQIFALLSHNPQLAGLICDILTIAPRLTDRLRRHPELMDRLLDADFFTPLPDASQLERRLWQGTSTGETETALDNLRDLVRQQQFQAELHLLRGLSSRTEIEACFTSLAEISVRIVLSLAVADMQRNHGPIAGDFVVLGLGRLGAASMTARSDLDLICLYDGPDDIQSKGSRPLGLGAWHMRLTQRLINWLSVATARGSLYEVDMRLRPDGQSGPLAVSWARFENYHDQQAWGWERLAMRRARLIATHQDENSPGQLAGRVAGWLEAQKTKRPPLPDLATDIADMRLRLAERRLGFWQMKQAAGGLLDAEFLDGLCAAGAKTGISARDFQANLARQQLIQHWLRIGLADTRQLADGQDNGLPKALGQEMAAALGLADSHALASQLASDRGELAAELDALTARYRGKTDPAS